MEFNTETFNEVKNYLGSQLNTVFSTIYNEINPEHTSTSGNDSPTELFFHFLMALMLAGIVGVNLWVMIKRRRQAEMVQINVLCTEVEEMLAIETEIISGMIRGDNKGDDNALSEVQERLLYLSERLNAVQEMVSDSESRIFNIFHI